MAIREKRHRLSEDDYKGEVSVSFTLCIKDRVQLFGDETIVANFTNILGNLIDRFSCIIPIYCFMPDHQHILLTGINEKANILGFIKAYLKGPLAVT
jgi:REP element-mobilizing transposase RayT